VEEVRDILLLARKHGVVTLEGSQAWLASPSDKNREKVKDSYQKAERVKPRNLLTTRCSVSPCPAVK
jgi:hypothetical protein